MRALRQWREYSLRKVAEVQICVHGTSSVSRYPVDMYYAAKLLEQLEAPGTAMGLRELMP